MILRWLKRLGRMIPRVFRRSPYNRQIVVIGPSPERCRQVVAGIQGLARLQIESRPAAEFDECLALGPRKAKRWMVRVPSQIQDPESKNWMADSDTAIICLAPEQIQEFDKYAFQVPVNLGEARDQYRMRHVAIAIVDIPAETGPRDESQAHLLIPRGLPPGRYLENALDGARNQPGHPLADPKWSEFLLGVFSVQAYERFYTQVCQAVGKPAPCFFLSGGIGQPLVSAALRRWIDRRTLRPATLRRRLAVGASMVLMVFAAGTFWLSASVTTQARDLGDAIDAVSSPRAVGNLAAWRHVVASAVAIEQSGVAILSRFLGASEHREKLSYLLASIERYQDGIDLLDDLDGASMVMLDNPNGEATVVSTLEEFKKRWYVLPGELRTRFASEWEQGALQLALAGTIATRQVTPFDAASVDRQPFLGALATGSDRIGGLSDWLMANLPDKAAQAPIRALATEPGLVRYLEILDNVIDEKANPELGRFVGRIADPEILKLTSQIREFPLLWVRENLDDIKHQLDVVESLATLRHITAISKEELEDCRVLRGQIEAAFARRRFVLEFTGHNRSEWHVHFVGENPRPSQAGTVRVERLGVYGDVIRVGINKSERTHLGNCRPQWMNIRLENGVVHFGPLKITVDNLPNWPPPPQQGDK